VDPVALPSSDGFVEAYAAVAERFAAAVSTSDLSAPVGACPGWSVLDLVAHLGNTHAWAATVVETGSPAPDQDDRPTSRRARAVSAWYLAKAEDLYRVLRAVPADRPCWNFAFGAGVAGFWPRRQLHETTIHLVDLELASGRPAAIASDVAADGVDEVLTVMVPRMHRRGHVAELVAPLEVSASDTGESWLLTPAAPPAVERRTRPAVEAGGDRLEAPADVLYRLLWKRETDTGAIRILGDHARIEAFLASRLTP
jgi:uncharacterized protein (TIGR03083 family)